MPESGVSLKSAVTPLCGRVIFQYFVSRLGRLDRRLGRAHGERNRCAAPEQAPLPIFRPQAGSERRPGAATGRGSAHKAARSPPAVRAARRHLGGRRKTAGPPESRPRTGVRVAGTRRLASPMISHLRRPAEPSAQRAARAPRRPDLAQRGGWTRPRRLAALALLVLAAAPPAAGSELPGSAQPAPGLCARARRAARRRDGVRGAAGRGAQPRWPVGWGRGPGGRLHRRIAAGEGDDFAGGRLMGISTLALMSVIAGAVLAVLPVAPGPVAPGPVAPPDLWLCRWHLPPSTDALPARRHSAAIVGSNSRVVCTLQNSRVLAGLCAGCWSRAEVLDAGGEGGCQRCVVPAVLWDRVLHSGV